MSPRLLRARLREKWIRFSRRGPGFNAESGRVCGAHFTDSDFEKSTDREHLGPTFNKRRLKRESVPSIWTPLPEFNSVESGHFLSGLGAPTSEIEEIFEDFDLDNASSNGSSSNSSATLRRSTRTRYNPREDELNPILVEGNSNDGSSSRGRRNLTRKSYFPATKKGTVYDDKGIFIQNGLDICDCFDQECPGCHFPLNRRWAFETKEIDGVRGSLIRNTFSQKKSAYEATKLGLLLKF
ncbi:C11orf46 -like protein [Caligus rogercresseyi]|uniref:C11orf46 -like protein n=1 Tax=Caligus rogercresseyi TaxID=217165 RepID=A0A7T8HIM5_CALRO|nr:C11orf46 -like protein [Caligus rogercresseyi]